ncbi:MAG: O-phosphoserine--tRNA ligase [Archaeoglobus sp.]|jgi:O-phosphoseryl-tRNA synthetase|nr:MAG: O-phosphoserine--tRNA ligase [Archaeoglobus sp.]
MKFNAKKYREIVESNFERAWLDGRKILAERDLNSKYPRLFYEFGKEHPLFSTVQKLREAYLRLGFAEVVNPLIVEDVHVKKQFGKEALAVLDRCFYLASLPKPNVGISAEKVKMLRSVVGDINEEKIERLREVFHSYKKGRIDGDDLSYEVANAIDVDDATAVSVIDMIFPEFKELKPESTNLTLRSHMTTGWFLTLSRVADRLPLPIKLFSVDRCFRKEQGEDATRLYTYFSASCVVVDENVSVDDGKAVAESLLRQFGFKRFKFRLDEKRSKYYIPGTQTEVFAYHPALVGTNTKYSDGWIEIATFGIYSPTALSQYDIEYPVMNLGLGVERLAMILYNYSDVRKLVYPQFYGGIRIDDLDIARAIKIDEVPKSVIGMEIARSVIKVAEENANEPSPCSFEAWAGKIYGRDVRVEVFEKEKNTRLCGPAYANEIVVYNGSIYGLPRSEKWMKYFEDGIPTGIRYIDGFAYKAGSFAEECAAKNTGGEIRVRVIESLSEINVKLQDNVRNYIVSTNGKIDVRGPMFVTVRVEVD